MSQSEIAGPAWDNSGEYADLAAPTIKADMERARQLTTELASQSAKVAPLLPRAEDLNKSEEKTAVTACQTGMRLFEEAMVLIRNVHTFVSCELSVDGGNERAKEVQSELEVLSASLNSAVSGMKLFLKLTSESAFEEFLRDDKARSMAFSLGRERNLRHQALSLPEEDLLIGLGVHGPTAFGNLYDNISGSLKCAVAMPDGTTRTTGLAEAASLQQNPDPKVRESAYRASRGAWLTQEEACAAILNSLSGWRHEVYKRRSKVKPVHFLDTPVHQGCISRPTLDAMMNSVSDFRSESQRVLRLMARALNKKTLDPWDIGAPCPTLAGEKPMPRPSFDEGMQLVESCFTSVDPEMGKFARMMADKKWIEGRVGPTKRPGAYCTGFAKSRTPRVYMTYTGTMREVKTLAHELGHAYHNWVMRDMPIFETMYPMTLAETASIFAETVVNETLNESAKTKGERLAYAWSAAREVDSILINVASRFTFEKDFYERREKHPLSPRQLRERMSAAWQDWYGDTLTETDDMFWASKLHFSIAGLSFYNYPYIFGYLFALGIYAKRATLGDDFFPAYKALLRDTGRMTAEDLAKKHLGEDLSKPDFWRGSLQIVKRDIDRFDDVVKECFPG